jgi:hypothetical protein
MVMDQHTAGAGADDGGGGGGEVIIHTTAAGAHGHEGRASILDAIDREVLMEVMGAFGGGGGGLGAMVQIEEEIFILD